MPPVAQAETTAATTETDLSNDFDAVFDAITNGASNNEDPAETPPAGQTNTSDHAAEPGKPGDGTGNTGEPAQPGGNTPPANGEGQPAGGDDNAAGGNQGNAAPEVDYKAQMAALQAQVDALKAAPAAPAVAPAGDAAPAAKAPPPIYNDAESAELATLQKDWPELKRMFELMSRQVEVNMVNYTFSELGKIIVPLQQSVGVLTGNDHVDAIYSAHADYDQAYTPCMEWIEKQPSFLKATYQNVVKNGTSEEVVEMIQKFKDETKWAAPAPAAAATTATTPAAKPAKSQGAELSVAAKKAAQAIGAVGTKRSGAPEVQDPSDFDGAWAEATAK